MDKNIVKVTHLEYGFVIFTNPTPRQEEVLQAYENYVTALKEIENDLKKNVEKKE
jgi:hypothetical protein